MMGESIAAAPAPPTQTDPAAVSPPLSLWRHPNFRRLWIGQTISLLGTQVTLLALPLTATISLGASAGQMGLLFAAEHAANLLVVLFAGAWVDRVRKRPVMIWANLARAALLGTIPLAAAVDLLSLAQLYVVALLTGLCAIFFSVAYSPFIVTLVSRERLVEANGKLELSRSVTALAGPGLAGFLVQVMAAPLAIALDALSFLLSSLVLGRIGVREPAPARPAERSGLRREIGEGLRFTWGHPLLRPIIISFGIFNLFGSFSGALYLLFVTETLGLPPGFLGVIAAVEAGCALAGALAAPRLAARVGAGPAFVAASLACGLATFFIPLARGPLPLAIGCLLGQAVLFGVFVSSLSIGFGSLTQAATPDRLMGRVRACIQLVISGTLPIGALAGGLLGEVAGLRPALVVAACGTLLAGLLLLGSPLRRLRALPTA